MGFSYSQTYFATKAALRGSMLMTQLKVVSTVHLTAKLVLIAVNVCHVIQKTLESFTTEQIDVWLCRVTSTFMCKAAILA